MNIDKFITLSFLVMISFGVFAAEEAVFSETFQNEAAFAKRWRNFSSPGKSSYQTSRDGLLVTVRNNPFNDGYIECDIPLLKKGMLEFEVDIPTGQQASGIGLFVEIYNISSFFHWHCRDWRSYFPEPVSKRLVSFNIEPVGHRRIAIVDRTKKGKYRIVFDGQRDRIEFYHDDFGNPKQIRNDVSVYGNNYFLGGKLRIGSMGYTSVPYTCRVSNLRLSELIPEQNVQTDKKDYLLFQGMTFDSLKVAEALEKSGIEKKHCIPYTLETNGASTLVMNRLLYNSIPGEKRINNAQCIALIDAPAGPDKILPDFLLQDMVDFVNAGGRLVIFGGFFTLEKGEFKNTALAQVLPVVLKDPWTTLDFRKPMPLKSVCRKYRWIEQGPKPFIVQLIHNLEVKPGAEVKLTAGGKPVLVEWKTGKGSVAVFLGMKAGRGFLFTDHPDWGKLVCQICKGE